MDEFMKEMEEMINKTAKAVQEGTKDLTNRIDLEKKKVEIKAQIGHHERATTKAYARLGEAYFNYVEKNDSMDGSNDVLDLIRSNKKVVELLNQQLKDLENK